MSSKQPAKMLAVERQRKILEMLDTSSSIRISDICDTFGVSAVTARSDLDVLERDGKLKRTHGGAVPVSQYVIPRVPQRLRRNAKAKQGIARYAASLVSDGEMILVGSGSTTLAFVRALSDKKGITIISNDCNVIEYAEQHLPDATIASTGGALGRDYRHYYGSMLASSLSDIYLDKVFLGADGFEPDFGFLAEFEQTALTKVEFLRHARTKIMLMDSTKVGAGRSFVRFAKPSEFDIVIMDKDPDGIVTAAVENPDHEVKIIQTEA